MNTKRNVWEGISYIAEPLLLIISILIMAISAAISVSGAFHPTKVVEALYGLILSIWMLVLYAVLFFNRKLREMQDPPIRVTVQPRPAVRHIVRARSSTNTE